MSKSVNDYYAEKMKRLLEMQKQENGSGQTAGSLPSGAPGRQKPQARENGIDVNAESAGHKYYNSFRSRSAAPQTRVSVQRSSFAAGTSIRSQTFAEYQRGTSRSPSPVAQTRPGASRPRQEYASPPFSGGAYGQSTPPQNGAGRAPYTPPRVRMDGAGEAGQRGQAYRGNNISGATGNPRTANRQNSSSPEQTAEDRNRERLAKEEALKKAKKARKARKVRDTVVSFALILAVFAVMCVVVYRLLFKVSEINVIGCESYTAEEIIAASGIDVGDHLYSFRASTLEKNVILHCPQVKSVAVNRNAPKKVNITVNEKPCAFYADFYGEYRAMSADLRVLYSVTEDEAVERGLIYLRLPAVSKAVAGSEAEYSSVRRDDYIYTVTEAMQSSELWGRIGAADLKDKYDIRIVCDGKYLLTLGDSSAVESKLRIGAAVLEDDMFNGNDKAKIDLSNLAATGVVIDNRLELDW